MKNTLLCMGLLLLFSFKHPYYLSVTELKYVPNEKVMQASSKLFLNDLETALSQLHGQTFDLINANNDIKTKQFLANYLKKRLKIKVNDLELPYDFIGFEREEGTIWLFYELKNCPVPQKIELENTLLYDFIKEQTNIMYVEWNGKKLSSKLKNPDNSALFE